MSVSFQIHCDGIQSQNYKNCVLVQIFMDPTVLWSADRQQVGLDIPHGDTIQEGSKPPVLFQKAEIL